MSTPINEPHDIFVTVTVEILGVAILAVIAGINGGIGSVIVIIMVGFLLVWLITHTSQLKQLVSDL